MSGIRIAVTCWDLLLTGYFTKEGILQMIRVKAIIRLLSMLFVFANITGFAFAQEPVKCGPEDEKDKITKPKGKHYVPAPASGKAMVVVMYKGTMGKSYQVKLSVDGQWRAVLKKNQYAFFEIEPGVRRMCWGGRVSKRDDNFLLITARAGQTYYILGTLTKGISEVDSTEGSKIMKDYDYVTFEVQR